MFSKFEKILLFFVALVCVFALIQEFRSSDDAKPVECAQHPAAGDEVSQNCKEEKNEQSK